MIITNDRFHFQNPKNYSLTWWAFGIENFGVRFLEWGTKWGGDNAEIEDINNIIFAFEEADKKLKETLKKSKKYIKKMMEQDDEDFLEKNGWTKKK